MKKYAILMCLLLVGCTTSDYGQTIVSRRSNDPSVVRILGKDGPMTNHGSGVVTEYGGKTIVITAYHVVVDAKNIEIRTKDNKPIYIEIELIKHMPKLDITVLYIREMVPRIKPMPIHQGSSIGDVVSAIGFPSNGDCVEHDGKITGMNVTSTCRVESGMSGGPLTSNGKLTGIAKGYTLNMTDGTRGGEHVGIKDILRHLKK